MRLNNPAIPTYRFMPAAIILALIFILNFPVTAFAQHSGETTNGFSNEDIKRGERFFEGLLPFNFDGNSCVSCHTMTTADTLNWNPSAMDIAVKFVDQDFSAFQATITEPVGVKITEAHAGINIAEEDLQKVKIYLDNLAITGPAPLKPSINHLLLFIFLGILITWALLELIFFKKMKYRFIPVIIFLGAFSYQAKMLVVEGVKLGRSEGYAPDQPIKFSHKVHAGENGIDCLYCHSTAEQSKSAGIPAMSLCMNCHVIIREGTNSGKFEISKVVNAVENNEPIEWVRIHNLPDHVFFSHAIHVGAGKLDCIQCHGAVDEMDIMTQAADLSMGWCINCHRETEVQAKDNGYYETFIKLHEGMDIEDLEGMTAADMGANDCMRCHY